MTYSTETPLPVGLVMDPSTGTITGSLAAALSVTVQVVATDTTGFSAKAALQLTFTTFPVAGAIPPQVAGVGLPFFFPLPAAACTSSTPLTVTASLASGAALPNWLSFSQATLTFAGTAQATDVTPLTSPIVVRVTCANALQASSSTTFSLLVVVFPVAPRLDPGKEVVPVNANSTLFTFTLAPTHFADPTLSLSATLSTGAPLPSWLTFAGRTLSGRLFSPTRLAALQTSVPTSPPPPFNLAVSFVATDPAGAKAVLPMTFSVSAFPTLARPIANQVAGTGVGFVLAVPLRPPSPSPSRPPASQTG